MVCTCPSHMPPPHFPSSLAQPLAYVLHRHRGELVREAHPLDLLRGLDRTCPASSGVASTRFGKASKYPSVKTVGSPSILSAICVPCESSSPIRSSPRSASTSSATSSDLNQGGRGHRGRSHGKGGCRPSTRCGRPPPPAARARSASARPRGGRRRCHSPSCTSSSTDRRRCRASGRRARRDPRRP